MKSTVNVRFLLILTLVTNFLGTTNSQGILSFINENLQWLNYGVAQILPGRRVYFQEEYDFIVIGAGSSGAVIASRLAEVEEWDVLLLEAGGNETYLTDIPMLATSLTRTHLDWDYRTKSSRTSCRAMYNNECGIPRGKVLGGTSVLSHMIYTRGIPKDYDDWARMGNVGWSYRDVLPFFLKSEDNRNPSYSHTPYHRRGGPLTVSNLPFATSLGSAFVAAGQFLGYNVNDPNAAEYEGFRPIQITERNGRRCSTNKAFLSPRVARENLDVYMKARVTRILIDYDTAVAFGVEFSPRSGESKTVFAKKEVILAAGVFNSPQLLMLSGVGPKAHLKSIGVPVVVNSPGVGENLHDHVGLGGLVYRTKGKSGITSSNTLSILNLLEYMRGKGPLTSAVGAEALGLVYTKYQNKTTKRPDVEILMLATSHLDDWDGSTLFSHNLLDDFYSRVYKPITGKDMFTMFPFILKPKSRGTVRLRSTDSLESPVIDLNPFAVKSDMARLIEGIKLSLNVSQSGPLKRYGTRLHDIPFPACRDMTFKSDEYFECASREYTQFANNAVGTCKMGPQTDKMAVVDSKLRVYGVKNLRVADASIMPVIISGHTNAACIMIGEKMAHMLKKDWVPDLLADEIEYFLPGVDVRVEPFDDFTEY